MSRWAIQINGLFAELAGTDLVPEILTTRPTTSFGLGGGAGVTDRRVEESRGSVFYEGPVIVSAVGLLRTRGMNAVRAKTELANRAVPNMGAFA